MEVFPWDVSFGEMQRVIRTDPVAGAYATLQAAQLRQWLSRVESREAVLVVSHGGIAEAGIIGLIDDTDVSGFGPLLDYCEGARIELHGETVRSVRLLRFHDDREIEVDPFSP